MMEAKSFAAMAMMEEGLAEIDSAGSRLTAQRNSARGTARAAAAREGEKRVQDLARRVRNEANETREAV